MTCTFLWPVQEMITFLSDTIKSMSRPYCTLRLGLFRFVQAGRSEVLLVLTTQWKYEVIDVTIRVWL